MAVMLRDYQEIVGQSGIEELFILAGRLPKCTMQHINSTAVGGGVAEILTRLIPLLQELGVDARWDVIKGDQAFYNVTKAFHNALHGHTEEISEQMFDIFRANLEMNLNRVDLSGDVMFIHDPQPAGLILHKPKIGGQWVWRCHIDVSAPQENVWNFLRDYVVRYDAAIFSMPDFAQRFPIPQFRIAPSIDPLSDKNKPLNRSCVEMVLNKHKLDPERPIITQISRFDRLKDPLGVIQAYKMVKRRQDCQLVLAGGGANDDPEGAQVFREVQEAAAGDADIHVLLLPPFSDIEINALVRASTIVLQKSVKEGFGLTVAEALWKRKPVIGGAVGGIRLQVINGVTGYLVHSPEGAANRISQLLRDRPLRERMGANGYRHVGQNFLVTRQIRDYLLTTLALSYPNQSLVDLTGTE